MKSIYLYSKRTDKIIFLLIFTTIVVFSHRITVYHHVFVADVELFRTQKNGTIVDEQTGNIPKLFGYGSFDKDTFWRSVENSINSNMEIKYNQFNYEQGTRFIWVIHYSYNSTKKDRTREYIFEADEKGRLRDKN